MKIYIKNGQPVFLQVQAPVSKETFQLVLEPVVVGFEGIRPKVGGLSVGDVTSYTNLDDEAIRENAHQQILAASQRLKDPQNYTGNQAYNNLMGIEHSVGSTNRQIAQKQKENGML